MLTLDRALNAMRHSPLGIWKRLRLAMVYSLRQGAPRNSSVASPMSLDAAGLGVGSAVVTVDGRKVKSAKSLARRLRKVPEGNTVSLQFTPPSGAARSRRSTDRVDRKSRRHDRGHDQNPSPQHEEKCRERRGQEDR